MLEMYNNKVKVDIFNKRLQAIKTSVLILTVAMDHMK